jgi:ABC-type transport system involved in cytochrome bd biosynthesis fused ATPase/permease subunit
MNLIILLCMPLIPVIIVTICAVVTNKKANKEAEQKTA